MSEKQNPNIDDSRADEHDANAPNTAITRSSQQFQDTDGEFINKRPGPDALSLAEQISRELDKGEKVGDQLVTDPSDQTRLIELQKMSMPELLEAAEAAELGDVAGVKRQELIFRILKNLVKTSGLMYGEGTLEILPDGFGFLRSPDYHYLSCPDDIYVSPSQIRRFNLRTGVTVAGQIRPPKENERYFALLRVETVNQVDPSENIARVHFDDLTPLHPHQRIVMEHDSAEVCTRIVDMITPIGFGQRGLIVSPPRAGKTILLQQMARAVLKNYPETYVVMLLIDERPEEVTDMEREVRGPNCEVISSTFDESPARHVHVSEMVIEKAKRMVECGTDVVIFMDSITRLARVGIPSANQVAKYCRADSMQTHYRNQRSSLVQLVKLKRAVR
jgi:transcription termination factor Rho